MNAKSHHCASKCRTDKGPNLATDFEIFLKHSCALERAHIAVWAFLSGTMLLI